MKSLLKAILLQFLVFPFLWFVGLFVVAAMISFRTTDETTRKPYTEHPELGDYVFTNFMGWWGNPYDGLVGDKRGEFAQWCVDNGIKPGSFRAMWIWASQRNPVNKWSRNVVGVDVAFCKIVKVFGDDSIFEDPGKCCVQLLCATRNDGKEFCRLFIALAYPFRPSKAFMLDIGWKVKLTHNGTKTDARPQDRYKGHVCTISPWKSL